MSGTQRFSGTTESGLVTEDGVLRDGKACAGEVVVPEGVTEIAEMAFYNNKALTGLTLNEGLVKIGNFAVSGCFELAYVQVSSSVAELGECALMKRYESNISFTHVMDNKEYYPEIRCQEGSWSDEAVRMLKSKDGGGPGFTIEHVVELKYI